MAEPAASDAGPPISDAQSEQGAPDAAKEPAEEGGVAADAGALPDDRRTSAEWHSYGHDLFNTRANLAERILSVDNVGRLERKWEWGGPTRAVTSTPSYRDGVLYFGNYEGRVVALDAADGSERWSVLGPGQELPMVTSSPSVTADAVFVGADSAMLYRFDRDDGSLVWMTKVDQFPSSRLWSSATLIEDLVVLGAGSLQVALSVLEPPNFQGQVVAYDAASGSRRWSFRLTEGTGVTVTSTAAIDPARKLLYVGTGQQYQGDTPYSDALLALHYESGEYVWHQQFTASDDFWVQNPDGPDADVLSSPILYRAAERDTVAVGDKAGAFRAMDRDSGEILWERKLTIGSHHGGIMSSPAYHDGVIYVCSGDGSALVFANAGSAAPERSLLFALDAENRGEILWQVTFDTGCMAPVSYANGVVYLPTNDGHARAFAAQTGEEIWNEPIGFPIAGGITIVNGRLYVPHGWDWLAPSAPGGLVAYGLPDGAEAGP